MHIKPTTVSQETTNQHHGQTGIAVEEQITIQCYCCSEMATDDQRALQAKGWGFYETFYLCPIHEIQADQ